MERLRFWHDQVFAKPPRHPGVVPWHQDYAYWTRTEPACHITLNLLLDDADEENGCLQFVPGSQMRLDRAPSHRVRAKGPLVGLLHEVHRGKAARAAPF